MNIKANAILGLRMKYYKFFSLKDGSFSPTTIFQRSPSSQVDFPFLENRTEKSSQTEDTKKDGLCRPLQTKEDQCDKSSQTEIVDKEPLIKRRIGKNEEKEKEDEEADSFTRRLVEEKERLVVELENGLKEKERLISNLQDELRFSQAKAAEFNQTAEEQVFLNALLYQAGD